MTSKKERAALLLIGAMLGIGSALWLGAASLYWTGSKIRIEIVRQ